MRFSRLILPLFPFLLIHLRFLHAFHQGAEDNELKPLHAQNCAVFYKDAFVLLLQIVKNEEKREKLDHKYTLFQVFPPLL